MNKKHIYPSEKVKEYINLYKNGLSIYKIGKLLNKRPNTVLVSLRYWNIPMRHLGDITENKVKDFLIKNEHNVIHQKGDSHFDLLVDGKRIDIKSAHLHKINKKYNYLAYIFDICHAENLYTDYHNVIDEFYLVFLDELNIPIYSLKSSQVYVKRFIKIYSNLNTKYPIKLVGYLN